MISGREPCPVATCSTAKFSTRYKAAGREVSTMTGQQHRRPTIPFSTTYRSRIPHVGVTTSHAMTEAQQGSGPSAASATSAATSNKAPTTSSVSSVAATESASASSKITAVSVGPNGVAAAGPAGAVGVGPEGQAAASESANATSTAGGAADGDGCGEGDC